MNTSEIALRVHGMSCEHCVRAITQAVRALDPGAAVRVDLSTGSVRLGTTARREDVVRAVEAEGYEVSAD